eukprot:scaffold26679_cov171-Skeletonema_menzelii.AAC.8
MCDSILFVGHGRTVLFHELDSQDRQGQVSRRRASDELELIAHRSSAVSWLQCQCICIVHI